MKLRKGDYIMIIRDTVIDFGSATLTKGMIFYLESRIGRSSCYNIKCITHDFENGKIDVKKEEAQKYRKRIVKKLKQKQIALIKLKQ